MKAEKTDHKIEVGKRLRFLMDELEIGSAQTLADDLGTQRSRVSNWLNGSAFPPPEVVKTLGDKYKLPLFDWLFAGDPAALPMSFYVRLRSRMEGMIPPKVAPLPEEEAPEDDQVEKVRVPKIRQSRPK